MYLYSVLPSSKVSAAVIQSYNCTFYIDQLVENADSIVIIDNEALYNIFTRSVKIEQPSQSDLNRSVSSFIPGITFSIRFSGQLNAEFCRLAVNLIPLPRLHYKNYRIIISIFSLSTKVNYNCHWSKSNVLLQLPPILFLWQLPPAIWGSGCEFHNSIFDAPRS